MFRQVGSGQGVSGAGTVSTETSWWGYRDTRPAGAITKDGEEEVLVEGQEVVCEEWVGQPVGDTDWRRRAKEQLRAM